MVSPAVAIISFLDLVDLEVCSYQYFQGQSFNPLISYDVQSDLWHDAQNGDWHEE